MISRAGTERNAGGSLPGSDPAFAVRNTGEGTSTHEGDVCSDWESAFVAFRNTFSPAPSVPANATGEVPEWMPSAEEMDRLWAQTAAGCILRGVAGSGAAWSAVIDLIASRAPDAPVVDVRRLLADYWMPALESNMDNEERMTRALAAQGVKCKEVQT